jgi:hypothetical protein
MRRYVGPLIGLAVFVVLLVVVLVTANGGGSSNSTSAVATPTLSAAQQDLQILNVVATDPITQLEIKTITTTNTLKLDNGTWKQTAPTALNLDSSVISATIQTLTSLRGVDVIPADKASNLATYGLDKPSLTVTLTAGSGSKTLLFGALNPATNNYYVKLADNAKVWTVNSGPVTTLLGWQTSPPTLAPTIAAPTGSPQTPLPTVTPSPTPTTPPTDTPAPTTAPPAATPSPGATGGATTPAPTTAPAATPTK